MPDAYGCVTLAFDRAEPLGLTLTPDCEVEAVGAGSQGAARGVVVGSRLVEVEGVNVATQARAIEQLQLARGPAVRVRFKLPVHVAIQESGTEAAARPDAHGCVMLSLEV